MKRIERCLDLDEETTARAVASREDTKALLDQLAKVATPGSGAAVSLIVLARMATPTCEWLDGDLRVEIVRDGGHATVVEVLTELGLGSRERVFGKVRFDVPFEEFTVAIERRPDMIAPMTVATSEPSRVILTANEGLRSDVFSASVVKVAKASLRSSPPPRRIDAPTPFMPIDTRVVREMMSKLDQDPQPSRGEVEVEFDNDDE